MVWRGARLWVIANAALIVVQAILPLLFLYIIKLLIDELTLMTTDGTVGGGWGDSLDLLLLAAAVALAQALCSALARLVGDAQAQALTDHMYTVLHAKSVEVDLGYYENPDYRDSLHRAQQQAPYRPGRVSNGLLEFGRSGLSLLALAGLLASFHWSVIPILLIASLPSVALRVHHAGRVYRWQRTHTPLERLTYYLNQLLTSIRFASELRLFHLGDLVQERFDQVRGQLRRERLRLTTRKCIGEFAGEAISVLGMFLLLGFFAYQTLDGAITIGSLVMYFQALQRAWGHVGQMLRSMTELYEDDLFLQDVYEFLDLKPSVLPPPHPQPVPERVTRGISLSRVTFRYPHGRATVLADLSLKIRAGEHVAVVGSNGSGKSTLVKLLCRLYDPGEGEIALDGTDIRRFDPVSLRRKFAVLGQDFARYQQTARENINYGRVGFDASTAEIVGAARLSGAHDVIARLSNGYDTVLGNTFGGSQELSVGEWQRIALARVFVRDADVLILDEPTSAMDASAEEQALARLRELGDGKTTILISHRLSAVKSADCIYVLDKGRIVESGTHASLMAQRGLYRRLFVMQSEQLATS